MTIRELHCVCGFDATSIRHTERANVMSFVSHMRTSSLAEPMPRLSHKKVGSGEGTRLADQLRQIIGGTITAVSFAASDKAVPRPVQEGLDVDTLSPCNYRTDYDTITA